MRSTTQAVIVPRRRSFHRLLAMGRAPVEQDDVSHRDLASMALFGASWCQGLIPLEPLRRAASDSAVPSNNQLPTYSQNELPSRVALDAHPSSPLSTGMQTAGGMCGLHSYKGLCLQVQKTLTAVSKLASACAAVNFRAHRYWESGPISYWLRRTWKMECVVSLLRACRALHVLLQFCLQGHCCSLEPAAFDDF